MRRVLPALVLVQTPPTQAGYNAPGASAARPFNLPGKYVEFDGAAAADKFAAAAAADQEAPSSYRLMQHARRTQRCCSFAAIIKSATRIPAGRRIPL